MTTYLVLVVIAAAVSLVGMAFVGVLAPRGLRLFVAGVLAVLLFTAVVARLFEGALDEEQRPLLLLFSGCWRCAAAAWRRPPCSTRSTVPACAPRRHPAWRHLDRRAGAPRGVRLPCRRHAGGGGDRACGQGPRALPRVEDRRHPKRHKSGVGERFIIGTMISLLWAAAALTWASVPADPPARTAGATTTARPVRSGA
jgi:hypothetical protein